MINGLDIAIMIVFLAVIAVGFFSGVYRLTAAIVAIYFASIVSTAFYVTLTESAQKHIASLGTQTGYLFFFVLLFFCFTALFTIVISKWLAGLKFPRRLEIMDNVGGAALGLVVSGLAVTLAATLLVVILEALNQTLGAGGSGTMVGQVHTQIDGSAFVPVFLKMSPYFVRLISPWFPNGLPPILAGAMEA